MYFFIDTETTGRPTRRGAHYSEVEVWPRIVAVSWAFWGSASEVASPSCEIIRPEGFAIPAEASRIHGITTERALRDGHPLRDVLSTLNAQIEIHRPSLLVAHNIEFDRPTLLAEFLRIRVVHNLDSLPTYCTMATGTSHCAIPGYHGKFKWPSLDELHRKLFNCPHIGTHDARADLIACARCFFQMQQIGLARAAAVIATPQSYSSVRSHPPEDDDDAGADAQDLLDVIYDFAASHPAFETDFVDSLQNQLDERGYLTRNQMSALRRIITKWHIG